MSSHVLSHSEKMTAVLQKRRKKVVSILDEQKRRLSRHQAWRLTAALIFLVSLVPLAMDKTARWGFLVPGVLMLVFAILVVRTRNLNRHVTRLLGYSEFIRRQELRVLGMPSGRSWKSAQDAAAVYPLVRDIGLVGSHSLWTLLDETITEGGRNRLLHWVSVTPQPVSSLEQRQKRVQALRPLTWFYTRLGIQANSNDLDVSSEQIREFLKKSFVPASFPKILAVNLVLWAVMVVAALLISMAGIAVPKLLLALFPVVSLFSLGSLSGAFSLGTGLSHHLSVLTPVFSGIEGRTESHPALREVCATIGRVRPSRQVQKMDTILGFLGTQTNPILHFVLNAILPWTVVSVFFIERLRKKVERDLPACLDELAEFEVLGSLLVFDRYQTSVYPSLRGGQGLVCRQIFHPLLDRRKAVANDFEFPGGKTLGLLTGSNMSGKSTFLRTLGINQTLANMGAPVFADSMETRPMVVESCIEVSDSLRDGYSYFYAEVRRLKDILTAASSGAPVLYLVDEIFRGTNNRERQIGSRAVIQSLARAQGAVGFVSTHDLELTALEQTCSSVLNLHFREDINSEGKMVFHYHLNAGPSPTTNALRIMAAEGIDVEVE